MSSHFPELRSLQDYIVLIIDFLTDNARVQITIVNQKFIKITIYEHGEIQLRSTSLLTATLIAAAEYVRCF